MNSKFLCVLALPAVLALAACAKSKEEASNPSNEGAQASVASNTATNESDETVLVKDLRAEKVELTILNSTMAEKALISQDDFVVNEDGTAWALKPNRDPSFIVKGKLVFYKNLDKIIKENSVACIFYGEVSRPKPFFQDRASYPVEFLVDIPSSNKGDPYVSDKAIRVVEIVLDGERLMFGMLCIKADENSPFTVGEIRQALKGVVEVKIKK